MYCTAGSTCDGLAFESEDFGPFASRLAAIEDAEAEEAS